MLLSQSTPVHSKPSPATPPKPCRKTVIDLQEQFRVLSHPPFPALRPISPKAKTCNLDRSVKSDQYKDEQSQGEGLVSRTTAILTGTDRIENSLQICFVFFQSECIVDQAPEFCD